MLVGLVACWLVGSCGPPQEEAKNTHSQESKDRRGTWSISNNFILRTRMLLGGIPPFHPTYFATIRRLGRLPFSIQPTTADYVQSSCVVHDRLGRKMPATQLQRFRAKEKIRTRGSWKSRSIYPLASKFQRKNCCCEKRTRFPKCLCHSALGPAA